jgi:two-component system, NtrC family, sensor kinase
MSTTNYRVLIVDDNPAIHADFAKILGPPSAPDGLDELEAMLLDRTVEPARGPGFTLAFAHQGRDALELVRQAVASAQPFALAFIDMRMPPGWDGLETIEQLWRVDPDLQIVICSAFSDYTWDDLHRRLGARDSLLIVKKPFDAIEVVQTAHALTTKWAMARQLAGHLGALEELVSDRTRELRDANAALAREMAERAKIEAEVRLSQKLEAVGQLAAGIAHEINTPIQYVGDNLRFLREATLELVAAVAAPEQSEDIASLAADIPAALDSIDGGVARIANIVRAMKELAHPGPREATSVDVVRSLGNALAVTASAYRHVADLETALVQVPPIVGFGSELNQVFLNLIVNAAHAIEERGTRGRLTIATKVEGEDVVISIADTGTGIPEANRDRIFDAFFTTKAVGKGTGQGLAISRSIVVDRHGGALTFDSKVGVGTTFYIRLPIHGRPRTGARPSA